MLHTKYIYFQSNTSINYH